MSYPFHFTLASILTVTASASALAAGPAGSTPSALPAAIPSFSVVHTGDVTPGRVQLSADGSTVIFQVFGEQPDHYRWTRDTGATLVADGESAYVNGMSGDGSVLVGWAGETAARWTVAAGWQSLDLPDGAGAGRISADGSTLVGTIPVPVQVPGDFKVEGFRWSESGGMTLMAPGIRSMPSSVSADGSAVTGFIRFEEEWRTFRWTPEGGMQMVMPSTPWGHLPEPHPIISGDGKVVVRWAKPVRIDDDYTAAFRWSESSGIVELQKVEGWVEAHPRAMSQDGSLVVGDLARQLGGPMGLGVVWDSTGAVQSAADYLTARGVKIPPTWTHLYPSGISHDGNTLAGYGGDWVTGQRMAWIATVPEPGFGILGLLAIPLMRRRSLDRVSVARR